MACPKVVFNWPCAGLRFTIDCPTAWCLTVPVNFLQVKNR